MMITVSCGGAARCKTGEGRLNRSGIDAPRAVELFEPGCLGLFKSINQADGITRVFLRVGKQVSPMIVELDRPDGKVGAKIVINAAADYPARAGAAGADVGAKMRHADQSVDEEMQLVVPGHELRTEKDVVFARANATLRFVIAAQISLQAEPVIEI